MKFSKTSGFTATGPVRWGRLSQLFLVSIFGLLVATLVSACQLITIDYLYVAGSPTGSSNGGNIQVFAVDSESGALRFAAGTDKKPFASGGTNPVAMVASADYANLFVANSDNDSVVHFAIASDGSLTKKDSVTLAEPPLFLAVNAAGTYLYVVSGTTTATLTEYSLSSGTIGSVAAQEALAVPGYAGDTVVPTGVTVLQNNGAVYATAYDQSAYNPGGTTTSNANPGWVFGFAVGTGGALTPASLSPYKAGVKPTALTADPTNRFVYVTDFASNELIGYGITGGSTLNFLISGPFRTGGEPSAVVIDPRGKYMYVSNSLDSTVTAYDIDLTTGIPSVAVNVTGSQTNTTDTQPDSIVVDPALGRFVYTGNFLGNSVSGFRLNPNSGSLAPTQATPYPTESKPTAVVCIPHGNHSLQTTLN